MSQMLLRSEIKTEKDIVWTRKKARTLCQFLKLDNQDQTRVATAVSEIIRNAYQYAKGGYIEYSLEKKYSHFYLMIKVTDKGQGIKHLKEIENGTYVSPEGMGVGLMGAKKLMEDFSIETSEQGTTIVMGKVLPQIKAPLNSTELANLVSLLLQIDSNSSNVIDELAKQNHEIVSTLNLLTVKSEELNRLNEELQDTNRGVVALYAELDEKAESLRLANEAKTSFLSNMTHEFRSPVNSILSIAEIIKSDAKHEKASEREKQIGFIIKAANSLSDLVNDLLDIAKIEAGKIQVRPTTFRLSEMMSTIRGLMKPLNMNEQLALVIEEISADDDVMITTDEAKLSQILRNLINNAIKYTEKGEVVVTTKVEAAFLSISVRDTGLGIPAEFIESIFEEFVQLDTHIHKLKKGTGLGLPLSRKLAHLLQGEITVESKPGIGSVFTLKVPVQVDNTTESSVAFDPKKSTKPIEATHQSSVLIVDDDNAMRYSITRALEDQKLFIKEARNVYEALSLSKTFFPDLIILDLVMPEKNGIDFINEIMNEKDLRNIPIFMHTSKQLEPEEKEFLEQSVQKILFKEPTHINLKNSVREYFAKKHSGN